MCKWIARVFAGLYLLALALLLVGSFGLFGQEQDPLSAVFLVPLGLPWVLWLDGIPDVLAPWFAALAPLLNLLILRQLCRAFGRNQSGEARE